MRTLLFVITLISLTACQRHYGTYTTPPNYTAWGITLRKDYTFNYGYSSCSWAEAGRGQYEIIGDTLQLKFEDFKNATHGNVDLREFSPHQDSVVVDMTVIDSLTLEAIPFASVLFTRAGEIISGTETNFYGQTSLSFPRAVAPVTFEVSYLGYSTFAFTIAEPGQYQAEVHMAGSSRVKPIPAQTRTFRIVAWKKDSLLLSWFPEDEYDIPLPTTLYRYQPK